MSQLEYHLVDVFTEEKFGGNQLAVFTDGEVLPDELMQNIARELNISETVFLLPPDDPSNTVKLRIFTPRSEVPFAGHPTIGTAFVLRRLHHIRKDGLVHFEENVGPIMVQVSTNADNTIQVDMYQPIPEFGPIFKDRRSIAEMLSIEMEDFLPEYPIQVLSSGVPFVFIPVRDLETIRKVKLNLDLWERYLSKGSAPNVFVFTMQTELPDSTVHCRMFAPAMGITEDPATGAASGPLGAYLVKHGLVSKIDSLSMISEQGFEINRPSLINIAVTADDNEITGVRIGGFCQYIGRGVIELD